MWNISAMPNQSRYSIEPKSTDLIHFVNNEATLMNDLLLSKKVLIGHVDKREVLVKKRQLKTYAINANENIARSLTFCPLCQMNHDLDNCDTS